MLKRIAERMHREEKGFTLIELMVVVLIIGILIAIAIPTFLGARARAQDRAAQSSLRNTVTSAKVLYTDNEDYTSATPGALGLAEPSLSFLALPGDDSDEPNEVSVSPTSDSVFHAAVMSKSGTCWFIRDAVDPAASPGTGWAKDTDAATCSGTNAVAVPELDYANGKTPSDAVDQ